jgi:hypothetical protein
MDVEEEKGRILIAQDVEYLRCMKKLFSYNVKYALKEIIFYKE